MTPPSVFGEGDPNLVTGKGPGALQVPVLDPITIALHLHLLASSASDDLFGYLTADEEQSAEQREHVEKRQQKLVLAYVLQLVLKNYGSHDTVIDYRVDKYIRQYWEQVNHRIQENERWWFYLSNWYQSDPIHFLARAHYEDPPKHWLSFLLPMLLCLSGSTRSAPGLELQKQLIEDPAKRFEWFHREVLPGYKNVSAEDQVAFDYQGGRKPLLAILESYRRARADVRGAGGHRGNLSSSRRARQNELVDYGRRHAAHAGCARGRQGILAFR